MSQHHRPDKANRVSAPAVRPEPPRRCCARRCLRRSGLRFRGLVTAGWTGLADSPRASLALAGAASSSSMRPVILPTVDGEREVGHVADAHAVPERGADGRRERHQASSVDSSSASLP